jgi:thiol:disulfide interchange protein DsbC
MRGDALRTWLLVPVAAAAVANIALLCTRTSFGSSWSHPTNLFASRALGVKPEELRASVIPGVFEFMRGTEAVYVSADGRYAIHGDLYDLRSSDDLTEKHRTEVRRKLIGTLDESQMVIFGPEPARYTVTAFTDVDCTYCRKLHSEIAEYNRLGIRVRYLLYPRAGPGSESWRKAEQVWCSADRKQALTQAKRGETLDARPCQTGVVAQSYALGEQMGVKGTPAIVLSNGELHSGYVPPLELAQLLQARQVQISRRGDSF